ncbi:sensor histidine kinase [Microbacterium sp.]|uniref:sensor histidine kinase n=1 Tax=Microbacterium sp. TaxID=51671 RepID=UPI003A93796A
MPEPRSARRSSASWVASDIPRLSIGRLLRSKRFWEVRPIRSIARLLLLAVVGVLILITVAFTISSGRFTRYDLLAVAFYAGLTTFVWHAVTATFIVMLVGTVGVVFTGSGGDLVELALAGLLVAATCSRSLIIFYGVVLTSLATYLNIATATLANGGVFGVAGIALISMFTGISFRLIKAREAFLVADRAHLVSRLEGVVREEHERIADELHDGIAHDLTLVLFHARALPMHTDAASRKVSIKTIEESAERALSSIQSLLSMMHGSELEAIHMPEDRYEEDLVEMVSGLGILLDDAGIPTRVTLPEHPLELSSMTQGVLTIVAIEAVTNILKHAPKSRSAKIDVRVGPVGTELIIGNVTSKSKNSSAAESGGRGLTRARQRLQQRGGSLEAGRADDGWVLRATFPRS